MRIIMKIHSECLKLLGCIAVFADIIYSIILPRVGRIANIGHVMPGTGYNVEVYDDEVIFRARNYIFGIWLPKYDYTIALV